jgi:NADH-quinone oxidoreductase subunit F
MVNADSRTGRDVRPREIVYDPLTLIEGCLIASFAMNANACYLSAANTSAKKRKRRLIVHDAGMVGKTRCKSAGVSTSTITETGRISAPKKPHYGESLEGKGVPRMKPPFPAGADTVWLPDHNNVESIATVPTILRRGPDWFAGFGLTTRAPNFMRSAVT